MLDDLGLAPTLRWYVEKVRKGSQVHIELSAEPCEDLLDKDLRLTCFRIVQEALNNVVRHSGATEAFVSLIARGGWIQITIKDNGRGFDLEKAKKEALEGKSFGLFGMIERAKVKGEKLSIKTEMGKGTEIKAELPLRLSNQGA